MPTWQPAAMRRPLFSYVASVLCITIALALTYIVEHTQSVSEHDTTAILPARLTANPPEQA